MNCKLSVVSLCMLLSFSRRAESLRGPFRGFLFRVPDRFSGFGSRVYDSGFISSLKLKGFGVSGFLAPSPEYRV